MSRRALSFAFALLAAVGCDPAPMPEDAGRDAGRPRDAGPGDANVAMCLPACGAAETCCVGLLGAEDSCHDLRNDPSHCGSCGIDCLATQRGDGCRNSQCFCGGEDLGCLGTRESFCCPPRTIGGSRYCANLDQSAADCDECGRACDPDRSDRCDGGRCQCGATNLLCAGGRESRCCADGADIGCVDTTTDTFHCGDCNILCQSGERCESGSCTRGASCEGGCPLGEVCCGGSCCARRRCIDGMCAVPADGGVDADAGIESDAGLESDAGVASDAAIGPDGGALDGGP